RPLLEGLDNLADYGEMSQFKGGDFFTIAPGIGGGGTYARDRFYATGMLAIGYGPQNQRFDLNGESYNRWVGSTSFNLKFGLGYNGKKYFAGVQAEAQPTSIAINETTLSASQLQTLLFLGYRFFDLPIPPLKALNSWLPSAETESQ